MRTDCLFSGLLIVVLTAALTACGGGGGGGNGGAGDRALGVNDSPVSGSLATGEETYYTLAAAAGTTYTVTVESLSGDIDLGVFLDNSFSDARLIAGSQSSSAIDAVSFTADGNRTYYIGLRGYQAGNYRISVTTGGGALQVSLDTTLLSFEAIRSGSAPAARTVAMTYTGAVAVVGYPPPITSAPAWLQVQVIGSQNANPLQVQVAVTDTSLPAGSYNTTLRFISTDLAGNSVVYSDVPVVYTVTDAISVGATALAFTRGQGAVSPPPAQDVGIQGNLAWSASADQPWVQLSPASGSGAGTLSVAVDAAALGLGSHSATVTVSDTAGHSQSIDVTFTIEPPGLSLDRSQVDISGTNGKAIPSQSVAVAMNTGAAVAWTASSDAPWLVLNGTGATPGTLTLGVDAQGANLASGTHSASVLLSATLDGSVVTQTLDVNLTLSPMTFSTTPAAVDFSGVWGADLGSQSAAFALDVDGTDYPWNATVSAPWLRVDGGATASGVNSGSLTLSVDNSAVSAPGDYTASVTISARINGDTLTHTVPVGLHLSGPSLVLGRQSVSFSAINGAPLAAQTVSVAMDNDASETWSADSSAAWLVADSGGGTTPGILTLSVDAGALASGSYSATVTVSTVVAGAPLSKTVSVDLTLSQPTLTLSPSTLTFAHLDETDSGSQTVNIALNTGSAAHSWSATLTGSPWLQADVVSGAVSAAGSDIHVHTDPAGLSAGSYSGSVEITVPVNGDTLSATLPVTFKAEPHRLFVADNGVALASMPTVQRLSHTLTVTENRAIATAWSASADQAWLSVTPAGTTDGELVLTADPSGLATDNIYLANVTISSSAADVVNTETVRVGLYVGSADPATGLEVLNPGANAIPDPVRPYVYVNSGADAIAVYNVHTGALVTTIGSVGGLVNHLVVSGDGRRLYAVDHTTASIAVVDLDTQTVVDTWSPITIDRFTDITTARPDGHAVVITGPGQVFDAADGRELAAFDPQFYDYAYLTAGAGGTLFAQEAYIAPHKLARFALRYSAVDDALVVEKTRQITESGLAADLKANVEGTRLYTASGSPYVFPVYDGTDLTAIATLAGGAYPNNVDLGPTGLLYGGRSTGLDEADVWVYDTNNGNAAVESLDVSTSSNDVTPRDLAVSGDGLRLVTIQRVLGTDVFVLKFSSVSP